MTLWSRVKRQQVCISPLKDLQSKNVTSRVQIKMIQVQRGKDTRSVRGVATLSYVTLKTTALSERKRPRTQPGAFHASIRYCAAWHFMKKSERPGELQLEPLNAWNFGAQGYIAQLCLRSSIARSIKSLHVRRPRQHHTPVSGLVRAR